MSRHLDRISQHSFIGSALNADSVVFDFGANRGEFALNIIRKYNCRVFAAEPVPALFDQFPRHERLVLHPVAIGCGAKSIELLVNSDAELSATSLEHEIVANVIGNRAAAKKICVPCLGLADFCSANGVEGVDLVKVDIEGAELGLFELTSDAALQACTQITVEFHDFWYPQLTQRTEEAKTRLRDLGFHMVRFTPNNKDVLFVNRARVQLSAFEWAYLENVARHVRFVGRGLMAVGRKLMGRRRAG